MTVVEATPTLHELAAVVNREYELAFQAARTSLEHAIRCGEALSEARIQVPEGQWSAWLTENFNGASSTANKMMRLALYQHQLPEGVGVDGAHAMLQGLQRTNGMIVEAEPSTKRAAVRLYNRGGMTLEQVADQFGVCASTVHNWVKRDERLRRDEAARKALERQERDRAVRKIGGAVAESYSLLRKTAQALDRAAEEATDREVRAALNSAMAKLHEAEDEIVKALGLS